MADSKPKMAIVHIASDTHGGFIDGAHNGVRFHVPVGSDTPVNEGTLAALQDSGVNVTVVKPAGGAADEGSSAASTTVLGTATRDFPVDQPGGIPVANPDGKPATLSQLVDKDVTDASKTQAVNADTSDRGTGVPVAGADTGSINQKLAPKAGPGRPKTKH